MFDDVTLKLKWPVSVSSRRAMGRSCLAPPKVWLVRQAASLSRVFFQSICLSPSSRQAGSLSDPWLDLPGFEEIAIWRAVDHRLASLRTARAHSSYMFQMGRGLFGILLEAGVPQIEYLRAKLSLIRLRPNLLNLHSRSELIHSRELCGGQPLPLLPGV